jgi:hypothetical protein
MSRILEFQPTDEQTVIARVLVELHQAIDISFPGANPSARQFSKTVLTHQNESTRVDNTPSVKPEPKSGQSQKNEDKIRQDSSRVSMTPKSAHKSTNAIPTMHTAEMRALLGESPFSRSLKTALLALLVLGIAVLIWLVFLRPETINDFN